MSLHASSPTLPFTPRHSSVIIMKIACSVSLHTLPKVVQKARPHYPRKAATSGEDKTDKLVYPVRKGEKDGDGGVSLLVHPQTGRE